MKRFQGVVLGLLGALLLLPGCDSKKGEGPATGGTPVVWRMPVGLNELGVYSDDAVYKLLANGPLPYTRWHYARLWNHVFFCPGGLMDALLDAYQAGKTTGYVPDSAREMDFAAFEAAFETWVGKGQDGAGALYQWVDWHGRIVPTDDSWQFVPDTLVLFFVDPGKQRLEQRAVALPVAQLRAATEHPDVEPFFAALADLQLMGVPSRVEGRYFERFDAAFLAANRIIRGQLRDLPVDLETGGDDADSLIAQLPFYWFRVGAGRDSLDLRFVSWRDPATALAPFFQGFAQVAPNLAPLAQQRFGDEGLPPEIVAALLESFHLGLLPATDLEGNALVYRDFVTRSNTYLEAIGKEERLSATEPWTRSSKTLPYFAEVAHTGMALRGDTLAPQYIELMCYAADASEPPTVWARFAWEDARRLLETRYGLVPEVLLQRSLLSSILDPAYPTCVLQGAPTMATALLQLEAIQNAETRPVSGWMYYYTPEADAHLDASDLERIRAVLGAEVLLQ